MFLGFHCGDTRKRNRRKKQTTPEGPNVLPWPLEGCSQVSHNQRQTCPREPAALNVNTATKQKTLVYPDLPKKNLPSFPCCLAHQNRTIAIASDFRVDGAKSPEIPQKEGVLGSDIAARNRKSLATFHRTLKSQCSIALSCLANRCDFSGYEKSARSFLEFSCIKFFHVPGHPGHSVSKTTEKGQLHKVFVRDIPTSGPRMSQEYPAQTLCV